ncbi:HDOD domain-containing protein [Thiorhodospira sibirica]|uniref:HDOD domain-containing protein n=1 Tax=Thiorhodospira sibirica TaxID=154347 RepID=UPI00022C2828|nr:HDOD domain-containing protein [Thiorhodospira sibirica]
MNLYTAQGSRIRQLNELPPIPVVAQRILTALSQEDKVSVHTLAQEIERDPGLTARIIGVANSAYFARNQQVFAVMEAISRLGFNMVRHLALGVVLNAPFRAGDCAHLDLQHYWLRAVLVATLANLLAPRVQVEPVNAGAAYLSGLLHRLGLLVLCAVEPQLSSQALSQYLQQPQRDEATLAQHLTAVLGIEHREAGAILGQRWHLPKESIAVITHIGERDYQGEYWPLVQLINASCDIIDTLLDHPGLLEPDAHTLHHLQSALGIPREPALQSITTCKQQLGQLRQIAAHLAME